MSKLIYIWLVLSITFVIACNKPIKKEETEYTYTLKVEYLNSNIPSDTIKVVSKHDPYLWIDDQVCILRTYEDYYPAAAYVRNFKILDKK